MIVNSCLRKSDTHVRIDQQPFKLYTILMYYFIEYYKYKWIQSRGWMVNKLPIRSILQILLGAEKNHLSFKILLLLSFLHISLYRALLSEIDIILKRPKTTDLLLTGTTVIWVTVALVIDVLSTIENKYYSHIYTFFNCLNNCDKLECTITRKQLNMYIQ